jgi:hypothetical protein
MRRAVLYIKDILTWADAFHEHYGWWPHRDSGAVAGVPNLTWGGVDQALQKGHRGLRPGITLARLLLKYRKRRHRNHLSHFTPEGILAWADEHHSRTGTWPGAHSGRIRVAPADTWLAVDKALRAGRRGLPGGSSLGRLLKERRGARNHANPTRMTPKQVLAWADAHFARDKAWPTRKSGYIEEEPSETWAAVDAAFVAGTRGLAGYGSLARLLARKRKVRNPKRLPALSVERIRLWAKRHYKRTGRWPTHRSGPIADKPGETWGGVHSALSYGWRGLPGGSSLHRVLLDMKTAKSNGSS